jgi:hypothetical protein
MSYWVEHFKAFEQSGLTQAAYCQQHELNAKLFSSRLGIYRETQAAVNPSLIPVQVEGFMAGPICLHHAKGHRLELPTSTPASWLAELLRGLG